MFTVSILINGSPIITRSARRVKDGIYAVDDGKTVKHKHDDGAVKLAIKLLKLVKEP